MFPQAGYQKQNKVNLVFLICYEQEVFVKNQNQNDKDEPSNDGNRENYQGSNSNKNPSANKISADARRQNPKLFSYSLKIVQHSKMLKIYHVNSYMESGNI